ncbi:MAG: hypothetical protein ABI629_09925 [bacterium]
MVNGSDRGGTDPGCTNRHAQRVIRATAAPGTDPLLSAYVLECEQCQHRYGANGADLTQRRCPKCQSGKPGTPMAPNELLRDS